MKNNIIKFSAVLFIVNLIAAFILAGTYGLTKTKIAYEQALIEKEAIKQVFPLGAEGRLEAAQGQGTVKYWNVFKGSSNKLSGYIFIAKKYGYASTIDTMVGMEKNGTITGVKIIYQNETPGLGAKIAESASSRTFLSAIKDTFLGRKGQAMPLSPYFTEQFKGKDIRTINLDKGNIDAITGATISSKAVLDSVKSSGNEILKENNE